MTRSVGYARLAGGGRRVGNDDCVGEEPPASGFSTHIGGSLFDAGLLTAEGDTRLATESPPETNLQQGDGAPLAHMISHLEGIDGRVALEYSQGRLELWGRAAESPEDTAMDTSEVEFLKEQPRGRRET